MPRARVNGIEIEFEHRGRGEPVLMVMGIGMQLVAWPEGLLAKLEARGLRLILVDNRDVGRSSRLASAGVPRLGPLIARRVLGLRPRAPYTLFDMASDLVGVLDALELPRAHVVGVSLGGMIAQAMAIAHGDRVASLVSMMSHPNTRLVPGRPRAMRKLLRRPARSRDEAVANQLDFFRTAGSTGFYRDDAELARRLGAAYDRSYDPAGFARQFAAVMATGDLAPGLARVRVPSLVVHGTEDPIFDLDAGRATARAIPGAAFRAVDGWGHDLAEGAWDVLVDAIAGHVLARRGTPRGADGS